MPMLEIGTTGPAVRKLQVALKAAGFDPGLLDGDFGAGTDAAVIAFQHSEGLLADGIAGPRTLKALGLVKSDALADAASASAHRWSRRCFPMRRSVTSERICRW